MAKQAHALSPDGMTLVVRRRVPGGIQTVTLHRQPGAGPFTAAYTVTFADCSPCSAQGGLLLCAGHGACLRHTAELRADKFKFVPAEIGGALVEMSGDAVPCRVTGREAA